MCLGTDDCFVYCAEFLLLFLSWLPSQSHATTSTECNQFSQNLCFAFLIFCGSSDHTTACQID